MKIISPLPHFPVHAHCYTLEIYIHICSETGFHYIVQAGLELAIDQVELKLIEIPPEFWG